MPGKDQDFSEEQGAVKLVARRLCGENTVFHVYFDHVEDAHGNSAERYLSVVPKAAGEDGITGVSILPLINGRFGLLKIFRHPLGRYSWEAPKGFREPGEDLRTAAVRELKEETGFEVEEAAVFELGFTAPDPGLVQGRLRLYSAEVSAPAEKHEQELGHSAVQTFSWSEVQRLIELGEIDDACTLALLLKYCLSTGSLAS